MSHLSNIPLVLCGPILRKTSVDQFTVWFALSEKCDVKLLLNNHEYTFLGHIPQKGMTYLQAGKNLYYLLINIERKDLFSSDEWIKYDVSFKPSETKEEKWYQISKEHPDLLYKGQNQLGFKIPSRVERILHGSCRKPHHPSIDGLLEGDYLIEHSFIHHTSKQSQPYPSFLIMSGDQIYADDVAAPLLHAIHQIGDTLGIYKETFQGCHNSDILNSDMLYSSPKCYYGRMTILPQLEENKDLISQFFKGSQKPIFTSITADNHLISLMENLVMYLLVWSPALWCHVDLTPPPSLNHDQRQKYDEQSKIISTFVSGLSNVRRLLAHLQVAMIFDDHDVSDDWNLNRAWEESVYNHPFSKRMVANSLTAYFISQGWGNAPNKFTSDFINTIQTILSAPGSDASDKAQQTLLEFEGWEYEWNTKPALIVLDTRTRRWRSERKAVKPSGLLDWEALVELQHKLFDHNSVILVAPAPIFGVKLIENIQKIFIWLRRPLVVDAENWMAHPGTANAILNIFLHRKTPQNFIILSGDVHYSFVYDVELRNRIGGPDIWQITSSGLKNEFPARLLSILDVLNRWLFSPKSLLNWFTKRKRMRITPRKPERHKSAHRTLNSSGIGIVDIDNQGKPVHIYQQISNHQKIEFHRMENHSRWE